MNSGKETGHSGTEMRTALPDGGLSQQKLVPISENERNEGPQRRSLSSEPALPPLRGVPAHRSFSFASHLEKAWGWDNYSACARMVHVPGSRRVSPVLQAVLPGKGPACTIEGASRGLKDEPGTVLALRKLAA